MLRVLFICLLLVPIISSAQMIFLKTVPLAAGDQFVLYPSQNMSMGGAAIALSDPWLDPFINPAEGSRITQNRFFATPAVYAIDDNLGGGRSLPLAGQFKSGPWFGTMMAAGQQLEMGVSSPFTIPVNRQNRNSSNHRFVPNAYYAFGMGKILGSGYSLAGRIAYDRLRAIGGVELLYDQNSSVVQDGNALDMRIGLSRQGSNNAIKALFLYNDFDMRQKVISPAWVWDPMQSTHLYVENTRENQDHTRTYGASLTYRESLPDSGYTIGAQFTINRKTHPKIPNYDLMRIPRDPGDTWAVNMGLGFAYKNKKTRFGVDFIYEPIWSTTWAAAVTDTMSRFGRPVFRGQKTVNNDFTFNNWIFRLGLSKLYGMIELSGGLQIHSYSYKLRQYDFIFETERNQSQEWWETIWNLGLKFRFTYFNIKYSGRYIYGSGRPYLGNTGIFLARGSAMRADLILAPASPLSVDNHGIYTHQFTLEIPLGNPGNKTKGVTL